MSSLRFRDRGSGSRPSALPGSCKAEAALSEHTSPSLDQRHGALRRAGSDLGTRQTHIKRYRSLREGPFTLRILHAPASGSSSIREPMTNAAKKPAPLSEASTATDALRPSPPATSRESCWQRLPGAEPVKFMDLRLGVCRWPVRDPHASTDVRYCGCACEPDASYCDVHTQMAIAPRRAR